MALDFIRHKMNNKQKISKITSKAPAYTRRYVRKSIDISDRIFLLMEELDLSQKDLAKALGKSPSEINKWLGGQHNFTIKTLAAIEEILNTNLVVVPGGKRQLKYYPEAGMAHELVRIIENGEVADLKFLADLEWVILDQKKKSNPIPRKTEPPKDKPSGELHFMVAC